MHKRLAHYVLAAILSVFTVAGIAGLITWHSQGLRLYSMQDSAMAPALQHGDLLLATKAQAIQIGDVINYPDVSNPRAAITRRVVGLSPGNAVITAKSDNSAQADAPIAADMVVGKTFKSVPLLGYLLDALRRPAGLAILIYVPAFMILRAEFKRLQRNLQPKTRHISSFVPVRAQSAL